MSNKYLEMISSSVITIDNKVDVIGIKIAKIEEHMRNQNGRLEKCEKISEWNQGKILIFSGVLATVDFLIILYIGLKSVGVI